MRNCLRIEFGISVEADYDGASRPRSAPPKPNEIVRQIRYNADGTLVAGASADHCVYFWETGTSKANAILIGHDEPVNCIGFSADRRTVASGDDAGVVRLWDLDAKHEVLRLKAHSLPVKCVAFSPDGRLLATATAYAPDKGGEVRIWFADPPAK
jgi:WD40 repeat protein